MEKSTELNGFWKRIRRYGTIGVILVSAMIAAIVFFGGGNGVAPVGEENDMENVRYFDK